MTRIRFRRLLGWVAALLVVAFLAGLVVAGRYVYEKGFTKKWRRFVFEEFRKRGVEVEFERLTLDPFQGLQARRVMIYDGPQRSAVLASIDKVVLDINYADLFRGQPFLGAVDLSNANLAIPIDPAQPRGKKTRINNLDARILFPPGQVYISHASASIHELEIQLRGRLINPQAFKLSPGSQESTQARTGLIVRTLDTLDKINSRGARPRLTVEVTGDLAHPDTLTADVMLEAPLLEIRDYRIQSLRAAMRYTRQRLTLSRLRAVDKLGRLDARGSFDFVSQKAEMNLHSALDLPRLLEAFDVTERLEEIELRGPAALDLEARGTFDGEPQFLVTGGVRLGGFRVQGVEFESFGTDYAWDGRRWYLRSLRLEHQSGEVTFNALQTDRFIGRMESSIDPTALLPFTTGKTQEFLAEWRFIRTPDIQLRFAGPSADPAQVIVNGSLRLGRTLFRGQSIEAASAQVHVEDRAARYSNCRLERSEGVATGSFTYDFGRKLVQLENCASTLDLQAVAHWIAPDFPRHVRPYRFRQPPAVRAEGTVYYKGGKGTDLQLRIDGPAGMDYTFLKKELPFTAVAGDLRFTDGRLRMSGVEAVLFEGAVRGEADISLGRGPQPYQASVQVEGVGFEPLTRLYFDYDASTGKLDGHIGFKGVGNDARTLTGEGRVTVADGNVFAIPFLGPLSGIVNSVIPGLGYSRARHATADFKMADGAILTENLEIEGRGFEMIGDGTLFFLADQIKFDIRINARGWPGVILTPVSKLFEYSASGKLSAPTWEAKNLPGI